MQSTNVNISPLLIDMFVVNLFQSGFQENGEGRMNVDLSKHATAFLLQARETHRLTQVIYAIDFPINCISFYSSNLKSNKLKLQNDLATVLTCHLGWTVHRWAAKGMSEKQFTLECVPTCFFTGHLWLDLTCMSQWYVVERFFSFFKCLWVCMLTAFFYMNFIM